MMSLVADYGSSDNESDRDVTQEGPETKGKSTDEEEEEDSSDAESVEETKDLTEKIKLPSARDLLGNSGGVGVQGVLTNKFKAAEDQKIANLERHVKMVRIFTKLLGCLMR